MKTIRAATCALSRDPHFWHLPQSESPFFSGFETGCLRFILIRVTPNEGRAEVTTRTADLMAENGILHACRALMGSH
jgi:hypothetical protein